MSGVTSQEYRNKIVDFHDTKKIDFLEVASQKNEKIEKVLHELIGLLYSDITGTQKERDKKNIQTIDRNYAKVIKSALNSQSGISSLFDKGKDLVKNEIKNGNIDSKLQQQILDRLKTEILKFSMENLKETKETSTEQTVEFTPTEREFGNFAATVLKNEKVIKRISDNITKTIKGQSKAQTKSIINLLTNNRYKEIAIKVQKLDVKRVGQIIENKKKNGVFSRLKKMKKTTNRFMAKFKDPRTYLKLFKVKRVKLIKKGFMGLYNEFVYKELIKRVDEFDAQEISKPKMAKALMKSLMKFGALKALGLLKTVGGFIWNSLKSMVKSLWKITKAIGKMGLAFLSTVKTLIFTPMGQWIVGFVSGIVWRALIKPIVDRVQPIIDSITGPIKKWLGIDGEFSIAQAKSAFAKKVIDFERKLLSPEFRRTLDNIKPIEDALNKLQFNFSKLELFINAGGWKKSVGAAAGAKVGQAGAILGSLVGLAFGPLGAVIGGAIGGAIGGIVGTFVKRYYEALPPTAAEAAEKSSIFADIRRQWESKPVTKNKKSVQKAMIHMAELRTQNMDKKKQKEQELEKEQKKTGKDRDEAKIKKLQQEISALDGELSDIQEMNNIAQGGYTPEQDKICQDILNRLNDGNNYFNLSKSNFETVDWFWNKAQEGEFVDNQVKTQRDKLLSFFKRISIQKAIQDFYDSTITFSKIRDQANEYLRGMLDKGIYLGHKNTYGQEATVQSYQRDKNGNILRDKNGKQILNRKELTMRGWFDGSLGNISEANQGNVSYDEEYYTRGLYSTYKQQAEGEAESIWNGLSKEYREILGDKEMIVRLLAPIIETEDSGTYEQKKKNVETYINSLCENALKFKDQKDDSEDEVPKSEGAMTKIANGITNAGVEMLKKMLEDNDVDEKTKIEIKQVLNDVERQGLLKEDSKEDKDKQKNDAKLKEIREENKKIQNDIVQLQDKIDDINKNKEQLLKGRANQFVSQEGETFLVPVEVQKKDDITSAGETSMEQKARESVNPFEAPNPFSKHVW